MKLKHLVLGTSLLLLGACSSSDDTTGSQLSAAEKACIDQGGWCVYANSQCGDASDCLCQTSVPGSCDQLPTSAVCGCDGQIYENDCAAHANRVDTRNTWTCDEPANSTACGWVRCSTQSQACKELWTDRPEASGYQCQEIGACTSCDCVQLETGCTCSVDAGRPRIECHALL